LTETEIDLALTITPNQWTKYGDPVGNVEKIINEEMKR
jgi:hypothetical protein